MASRKSKKPGDNRVVRRPPSERKRIDPELEPLARGEQKRLRPPPRRPRLNDPRAVALVPGVANRDARAVAEARRDRIRRACQRHPDDPEATRELGVLLAEAVRLGLWRGLSVTGFDAFAEDLLGLSTGEAHRLASEGAAELDAPEEQASAESVAIWMRAEAALLEAGIEGRIGCRGERGSEKLGLELSPDHAPKALAEIGRRMLPLVRDREEGDDKNAGERDTKPPKDRPPKDKPPKDRPPKGRRPGPHSGGSGPAGD